MIGLSWVPNATIQTVMFFFFASWQAKLKRFSIVWVSDRGEPGAQRRRSSGSKP